MDFYKLLTRIEAAYKVSDDYIAALKGFSEANLSLEQKKAVIPHVLESVHRVREDLYSPSMDVEKSSSVIASVELLLSKFLEGDLAYREHELVNFCRYLKPWSSHMCGFYDKAGRKVRFPMVDFLKQFEFTFERFGMSADTIKYIQDELQKTEMLHEKYMHQFYKTDAEAQQVSSYFSDLVAIIEPKNRPVDKPFHFPPVDIGNELNSIIRELPHQDKFQEVFHTINQLKTNKPSKTFFNTVNPLIQQIGEPIYTHQVCRMLLLAVEQPLSDYPNYLSHFADVQTKHDYLCSETKHFIKGLVWTLKDCTDANSIKVLTALLETAYTKIQNIGPACKLVGNAAIHVLANMDVEGLGALSRIRLKVQHDSGIVLIDKQLEAGAKKLGVTVEKLGEMAVPDFGFE